MRGTTGYRPTALLRMERRLEIRLDRMSRPEATDPHKKSRPSLGGISFAFANLLCDLVFDDVLEAFDLHALAGAQSKVSGLTRFI